MKKVDNSNLEKITGGGAISLGGVLLLTFGALSILISGIFQGYTNPRGCNEKS